MSTRRHNWVLLMQQVEHVQGNVCVHWKVTSQQNFFKDWRTGEEDLFLVSLDNYYLLSRSPDCTAFGYSYVIQRVKACLSWTLQHVWSLSVPGKTEATPPQKMKRKIGPGSLPSYTGLKTTTEEKQKCLQHNAPAMESTSISKQIKTH